MPPLARTSLSLALVAAGCGLALIDPLPAVPVLSLLLIGVGFAGLLGRVRPGRGPAPAPAHLAPGTRPGGDAALQGAGAHGPDDMPWPAEVPAGLDGSLPAATAAGDSFEEDLTESLPCSERQIDERDAACSTPAAGSTFRFRVPLQPAGEGAAPGAQPPSALQGGPAPAPAPEPPLRVRHEVLVVEDNAVNQEVIGQMLAWLGCRPSLASSGPEGLQRLCERRFDLVLMDVQMPGMDGVEALGRLRAGPGGEHAFVNPPTLPVVAVTANALGGDEQRLRALGFDDYLSKPFRQQQLQDLLGRWLDGLPPRPALPVAASPAIPAPAGPAFAADPAVFDPRALERLRELDPGGENRVLPRLFQAFDASLSRMRGEIEAAWGSGDTAALHAAVHTLKSSSASLGALELSGLCAEIEGSLRAGAGMPGEPRRLELLEEAGRVQRSLKTMLGASHEAA